MSLGNVLRLEILVFFHEDELTYAFIMFSKLWNAHTIVLGKKMKKLKKLGTECRK